MNFTAKDVATLREKTGCGMMDCKKALTESNGDMEAAIDVLREKGLAKAAKKAGRIAAEGVAFAYVNDTATVGVVIEVNAETDFVAKNAEFQEFVKVCADTVMEQNPADVEALLACTAAGSDQTVDALLKDKILVIGENIKVRRFARMEGKVAAYIHAGGNIGVLVNFETEADPTAPAFQEMGKNVAMQVAAMNAPYLNRDAVPEDVLAHEKEILTLQIVNEGKPEAIAQKIVNGRLGKFYKENCLVEQVYVKDGDLTVQKYVDQVGKELGAAITVKDFVRFAKGEGLEKKVDDFAAEIASMVK